MTDTLMIIFVVIVIPIGLVYFPRTLLALSIKNVIAKTSTNWAIAFFVFCLIFDILLIIRDIMFNSKKSTQ